MYPAKHPDAELQYGFDFEPECARRWLPYTDYAAGVRIRIYGRGDASGFEHESSGGRTGATPPRFAAVAAGTSEQDGSITWTARALSTSSLTRQVSGTPTWVADAGITVSDQAIEGMIATVHLAGGEDGSNYNVTVTAALSDGQSAVGHMVLPVRVPEVPCDYQV